MTNDTKKVSSGKPAKPYPEFPLFPHATKRWAKKIRGKMHYFGPWDDPHGALERFEQQRDRLYAGMDPQPRKPTIRDLCNRFLKSKKLAVETGELTQRSYNDYKKATDRLIRVLGKMRPLESLGVKDWETLRADIAKTRSVRSLGNEIGRIRCVLKYAYDAELVDRPIRYRTFARPSKKRLRIERSKQPKKLFTAKQIKALLKSASVQMKAMILLGINCGFGNSDCATLPYSAVDLTTKWIDFPRGKTGEHRRCKLWPETVEAIQAAIKVRPTPKDPEHEDRIFITKYGQLWVKENTSTNPLSSEFRKLLIDADFHQMGIGFYSLRHTFATVAGETRDQVAVNHIMGHADSTMAGQYREEISDDRLEAVSKHVHDWLYPPKKKGGAK